MTTLDSLWNYPDPAGSAERFREVIASLDADQISQRSEAMTQLARAQGLTRDYDAARATLDEVHTAIDRHGAGSLSPADREWALVELRYWLELGRVFNDTIKPDEARECFERAAAIGKQHGFHRLAVDALHMIAIVAAGEEAVAKNLEAMDYATAYGDADALQWMGTLRNNLGWAYSSLGRHAEAFDVFEALTEFERTNNRPKRVRAAQWCAAKQLRLLGRVEEALERQRILFDTKSADESDGYSHEEIAECLLAMGKNEESRPHFARAYEVLKQDPWFPPTEAERLSRIKRLGGV